MADVSNETAESHTFDYTSSKGTKKINVAQYFKERYNIVLQYPKLQCLVVGTKGSLMPMEVSLNLSCLLCHMLAISAVIKEDGQFILRFPI